MIEFKIWVIDQINVYKLIWKNCIAELFINCKMYKYNKVFGKISYINNSILHRLLL